MNNSFDWNSPELIQLIQSGLNEDIGKGDFSVLAAIGNETQGSAEMIMKEDAIIAGLPLAQIIYSLIDPTIQIETAAMEGSKVSKGQRILTVKGKASTILSGERLVLNFIQRLSGIATVANHYATLAKPYGVTILDTRKTTPGLRKLEKYAVKTGGCDNHRMGLYDMIMLKDNHIDFCGGITPAILKTQAYLKENNLSLPIEVETRNLAEVTEVCMIGGIQRIMLDNFSPDEIKEALKVINKQFETEASGGITKENLEAYLATGVDFISIGALTHSVKSTDISLKTTLL
jgi:nicotinate-nucleotide pyrophosphorylase (carboxylating)